MYVIYASKKGFSSYLLGMHSVKGWRYYYIIVFLLKTPLVTLFFTFLMLFSFFKIKIKKGEWFLIIPILFIFIQASLSSKQIGIHYILPIYPLLFVLNSRIMQNIKIFYLKRYRLAFLGIGYLISSFSIF